MIKIGLVCMGADILFSVVLKAGFLGVIQALLVATSVWFLTYWICRKFQVAERFSAIIASANSNCGVSATIAAGGAILGNKQEISYMVAWVLVRADRPFLIIRSRAEAKVIGSIAIEDIFWSSLGGRHQTTEESFSPAHSHFQMAGTRSDGI